MWPQIVPLPLQCLPERPKWPQNHLPTAVRRLKWTCTRVISEELHGNSCEIKLTIDFCSNFVQWIFNIWELQFRKKEWGAHARYGAVRHWKCPILALFHACGKTAVSVIVRSLWAQTRKNTHKFTANTLCRTQINISSLIPNWTK